MTLNTKDHSRDSAGLRYVYPVVSRRAGGVSVGINLNPNSACNWACVYCQVPGLVRGSAPTIDLERLASELDGFLGEVTGDGWMVANAPEGARRLNDIAFSGNGEPTTADEFARCVDIAVLARETHAPGIKTVLITNGSMIGKPAVDQGVATLAGARGEVWFKIDCAGPHARFAINGARGSDAGVAERLARSCEICPSTWVQTCLFTMDGEAPRPDAIDAYAALLNGSMERGPRPAGVLLYGLARPSLQPEAGRLGRLGADQIEAIGARIAELTGLDVKVTP